MTPSASDIDFDRKPLAVRSVVIAPRTAARDSLVLQTALSKRLARPARLQLDQVLLDPSAGSLETQRAELAQASDTALAVDGEAERITQLVAVAVAAGVAPGDVTIDRDHRRATVSATPLPGAGPQTYRALEQRLSRAASGWQVAIVPPLAQFPAIRFADDVDTLERPALNQRRGLAVAGLLREQGIAVVPAPAEGQAFTLRAQEP